MSHLPFEHRVVCAQCGHVEPDELALEGEGDTLNGRACAQCGIGPMRPVGVGRTCPDDGKCGHGCALTASCWRVANCGPLSVTGFDEWPAWVVAAHPPKKRVAYTLDEHPPGSTGSKPTTVVVKSFVPSLVSPGSYVGTYRAMMGDDDTTR